MSSKKIVTYKSMSHLVQKLRKDLNGAGLKFLLLFAYNGTGKTRLSMEFKEAGKKKGVERDTLYYNAFTEDLFTWDNDLDGDSERIMKINSSSRFFSGLKELEMENRIRPWLSHYADFDFRIDYENWTIRFSRQVQGEIIDNIKISRGEENIFIWCFFLAIVELAIDGVDAYKWVKFIYIDDPISSLDDNNAVAVASNLAQLLKDKDSSICTVISSHHALFFNVMYNELRANYSKNAKAYFLCCLKNTGSFGLRDTSDTPFFHHIAMLAELHKAEKSGNLYTYHFNILRSILEKTATFHGFENFSACIKRDPDDTEGIMHQRLINILSHGKYSLYEPQEMLDENKAYFKKILTDYMDRYAFNQELFTEELEEVAAA